jgi:hypothetical protein
LSFEKAQNIMMKNILGVRGMTFNLALHAELGLFPLTINKVNINKKIF